MAVALVKSEKSKSMRLSMRIPFLARSIPNNLVDLNVDSDGSFGSFGIDSMSLFQTLCNVCREHLLPSTEMASVYRHLQIM